MTYSVDRRIGIISLGCDKNRVDSERLAGLLAGAGFQIIWLEDPEPINLKALIINTCGFIHSAKEESVNTILEAVDLKEEGYYQSLYVMGCLVERYKQILPEEIPEVDGWFGPEAFMDVLRTLGGRCDMKPQRVLSSPKHYAYLKVSEGCNRKCAFCAIPLMRGTFRSRSIEEIKAEAKELAKKGVKELLLVAQDMSMYGADIYNKPALKELALQLSDIEELEWIRFHYLYPRPFPYELIEIMHPSKSKVVPYVDMPVQHGSDEILRKMRRAITRQYLIDVINKMRDINPDVVFRTTFIVGFPGETQQHFEELLSFIEITHPERMGIFPYSHEEDTYAYKHFKDDVSEELKQKRIEQAMELYQVLVRQWMTQQIGRIVPVLVDSVTKDYVMGHTWWESPDVDSSIFLAPNKKITKGQLIHAELTGFDSLDWFGEKVTDTLKVAR